MTETTAVEMTETPTATGPDAGADQIDWDLIDWDLVVVGGGTAGLVASRTAAGFGARVLLLERERLGGECLWTGCVPSKALLAAARAAGEARHGEALGVSTVTHVDFRRVLEHIHSAMRAIAPHDSAAALEADGVSVLQSGVRFTGPRTLQTDDGRTIRFRQAVIATGSAPRQLRLQGDEVEMLTNETVWDIGALPARLAVIGGGAVACELAQAFARLGSKVTVLQRGPRLLTREDPEAAAVIADSLAADGVEVRCDVVARKAESVDGRAGNLILDDGSSVPFDRVLMAVGRIPRTADLGLDAAGVALDETGAVQVDSRLRTSNPRIRAAGDVTPLPRFTHTAGVNGSNAATDAILGLPRKVDPVVPRVTYTHPELAAVGAQEPGTGQRAVTVQHRELDRAIAEADTVGFTRLVLDAQGVVVGGTIVGPRAGESLAEITLAVRQGLKASRLAETTHPYPTFNDAVWNASIMDVRRRLRTRTLRLVTTVLAGVQRVRLH